jgi:ectoine hydroxylase-related dioxygenase (phytanoyl-CoA dioxygenase family)
MNLLTTEELSGWRDRGYLVLSSFFAPREVEAVNALIDRRMANPSSFGKATVDVLHGALVGQRLRAVEAPAEAFRGPIKINDLFIDEPEVRDLALNRKLTQILSELLDGAPIICNSLNFLWGSQQPDHFDTWYMPPPVQNKLAVTSICLEDVSPHAGPLAYYPGTHRIPPYRFSHGGIHAIESEMPAGRAYIAEQMAAMKSERKEFIGRQGDVFLWHGQLLHGGSRITEMRQTRKTLVTHYWRAQDVEPHFAFQVHESGYYYRRGHSSAG